HLNQTFVRYPLSHPPTSPLFPYTTLFRSSGPELLPQPCVRPSLGEKDILHGIVFDPLGPRPRQEVCLAFAAARRSQEGFGQTGRDRKSTRLNSSHDQISYAVFCLKKKKKS